jgi:hypothetical protein
MVRWVTPTVALIGNTFATRLRRPEDLKYRASQSNVLAADNDIGGHIWSLKRRLVFLVFANAEAEGGPQDTV